MSSPCRGVRAAVALLTVGSVYLAVMAIRYAIRMTLYPPERWSGGSIPIFFHWVLAGFILVLGFYHRRFAPAASASLHPMRARVLQSVAGLSDRVGRRRSCGVYQLAPMLLARVLGVRPAEYAVRIDRRVAMTTSDGVALVSDIYHPVRAGATPTILVRIPFSKTIGNSLIATVVGRFWAERGYRVVIQGTRGRYESGGDHYPLIHERGDGLDTLAWLKRQPWFDGRLGMWGGSAFGHTQWAVADQLPAPPSGRSALMVQISSTDFHGMFYPGGAFSLASALFWAIRSRGRGRRMAGCRRDVAGRLRRGRQRGRRRQQRRRAPAEVPHLIGRDGARRAAAPPPPRSRRLGSNLCSHADGPSGRERETASHQRRAAARDRGRRGRGRGDPRHRPRAVPLRLRRRRGDGGHAARAVALGVLTHPPAPTRCRPAWPSSRASCGRCSPSSARTWSPSSGCSSRSTCAPRCRSARPAASRWPRPSPPGCEVVQYSPNQVKQAVAGWGAAGKEQVQRMVQTLLGLADAAQAGRRRRRRRAGAVPPGHRAAAGRAGRGAGGRR